MIRKVISLVALIALSYLAIAPRDSSACLPMPLFPWEPDENEVGVDTTPPQAIVVRGVNISRSHLNEGCEGGCGDELGSIWIEMELADDRTPPDRMGVRLLVVEGVAPVAIPDYPVLADIYVSWNDGDGANQDEIDFVLEVTPLDLAGNEGPSTRIRVHHPGFGGCATVPGSLFAAYLVLGILALRQITARIGRARRSGQPRRAADNLAES
jgi:hypothetical protein